MNPETQTFHSEPDITTFVEPHPSLALCQLQPFNEVRFDSAIALLSKIHHQALSKYEIIKLHVLMDIFHTLQTGNPIIGGSLEPWPGGPVIAEAYSRIDNWCDRFDYTGTMPQGFTIQSKGQLRFVMPTFEPDPEDFSDSEMNAMEQAWDLLMPMMKKGYQGYLESQEFFHSDQTFLGRAYNRAKAQSRPMDWNDIVQAYEDLAGVPMGHIKALINL